MKVFYLSSLCSINEYERLFKKYGTTSSHASQKFHRLMVRGLRENGVEIEIVTHRSVKKMDEDDLRGAVETIDGVTYHYLSQCKYIKWNRIYTIVKIYQKLKYLQKNNPDMNICVDILKGELSIAVSVFKLFHKCKTIGIVTDVPVFRACETRKGIRALPIKLKNWLISDYDAYVFLTEKMNEILNPTHKPYVIIEGIADDQISEIPNELEEKYPEKVVLMAGLLEKEYGVDDLVEAFHNLEMKDVQLHFYGKGSSVAVINEYAKKDSRIHFYGEVLNHVIMDAERKATLLVNPRQAVGDWVLFSFPSKNIEYISSGTPLVAYELPCIPDEYKGYYIAIDDRGLKYTLRECLTQNRDEIHGFGIKAQTWIHVNKNPQKQTELLVSMMKAL